MQTESIKSFQDLKHLIRPRRPGGTIKEYPVQLKDIAIKEYSSGAKISDIASTFEMSYSTVKTWLQVAGVYKNTGKTYKRHSEEFKKMVVAEVMAGASQKAVAARHNIPNNGVISNWFRQRKYRGIKHGPRLKDRPIMDTLLQYDNDSGNGNGHKEEKTLNASAVARATQIVLQDPELAKAVVKLVADLRAAY